MLVFYCAENNFTTNYIKEVRTQKDSLTCFYLEEMKDYTKTKCKKNKHFNTALFIYRKAVHPSRLQLSFVLLSILQHTERTSLTSGDVRMSLIR